MTLIEFRRLVYGYLRESGDTSRAFGLHAANDSHFVADLRDGRRPRTATRQKVIDYIAAQAARKLGPKGRAAGQRPNKRR